MVICLERVADLHMAQLMPLPLSVSCFSKIQIGFTFMVPAHLYSPGKGPLKGCVCVCAFQKIPKMCSRPTTAGHDKARQKYLPLSLAAGCHPVKPIRQLHGKTTKAYGHNGSKTVRTRDSSASVPKCLRTLRH